MSFGSSVRKSLSFGTGLRQATHRWNTSPPLGVQSFVKPPQGLRVGRRRGAVTTPLKPAIQDHGGSLPFGFRAPEALSQFVRIVIVSRRHLRKDKYVDFVGEYHIDLLQQFGAVPIIIPRTEPTREQLDAYLAGGIDGVLVMEGNDLGMQYNPYGDVDALPDDVTQEVCAKHASDVETDDTKDSLEMRLIKEKVLGEGVPYLGLCRGSQMLNVAMEGTLYFDVAAETRTTVRHIDYENYDGHRHPLSVLPHTPLAGWFREEFQGLKKYAAVELSVNSYHHQGIRTLAPGLQPLCYDPDGLVEGFYDPGMYDPENGKYRVGLQWHPERMMHDYAGCVRVYRDFVRAATTHRQMMNSALHIEPPVQVHHGLTRRNGGSRRMRQAVM